MHLPEATRQRERIRSGRERRTRIQKRKGRGNKVGNQDTPQYIQTTLNNFIEKRYQANAGAGNRIIEEKDNNDIKFFLQNPSGVLNKDGKLDDRRAYLALWEWGVDVIALPETNKNWELYWLRNQWAGEVRRVWRHAKIYTASITAPTDRFATHI